MGLAVSLVAFLRSEDYRTLPRDKRVRSSADSFAEVSRGGWVETAYRSTKFLLGLQLPDIIGPRLEPCLSDSLHWCGLQGLECSVQKQRVCR
jgi:hypothetical protein